MQIQNKIAVVVGGASGLGKASAQLLQQNGAKVIIWDKTKPSETAENIPWIACEVEKATSLEAALETTISQYGIPHIAVHCAGIVSAFRLFDKEGVASPLEYFQKVLEVNLLGSCNMLRIMAAAMQKHTPDAETQERGVCILTASVAAYEGQIGQVAYSASKGGVVGMTLPAARELASFGIRVNTIAPGVMGTPMMRSMPEAVQQSLSQNVPFPKRLGEPEEFAALVAHLITNTYMNGAVVRLDGALRLQAK
ncbi:MAG: SDR family oxidoreductase [Legionellaceae bacterium]|nr:SDR family oxidoreductase [Legionellaceae bacterium]